MLKKWTYFIITMVILIGTIALPVDKGEAASLSDIPQELAKEINFLVAEKIIDGFPDKTFRPNDSLTREQAAKILGVALQLDGTQRETKFTDVRKSSYASGYITSAVKRKIIEGHTDGTFRPGENITREQAAFLLNRAFDLKGKGETSFSDVPRSNEKLYQAVDAMYANGLTINRTGTKFEPKVAINRAEFSVLVARGLNEQFRTAAIEQPKEERMVRVDSTLNVRSSPSAANNTNIIGKFQNETVVQLIDTYHQPWVYVKAGTTAGYVHSNYLATLTEKPVQPLKRYIAIDAGHGGTDPGASGNGLIEKEITLIVAKKVEQSLKKHGIDVFMVRTKDEGISLSDRVTRAKAAEVDALVSIHTNAFGKESANGTETFYNTAALSTRVDESKQLATFIQKRVQAALDTRNRGVKTANFAVIRTPFPSALVELAFISNEEDAKKLGSVEYQQKAADAIARGIADYYDWLETER